VFFQVASRRYHDFLNREANQLGLDFWMGQIRVLAHSLTLGLYAFTCFAGSALT
jgi:hypothetical protein